MVRIKERYLLVNVLYPTDISAEPSSSNVPDLVALNAPTTDKFDRGAILREIRAQVASLFGDYGSGAVSSLQLKYLSTATSTFILKVNRAHYRLVWSALTMMDHVPVRDGKLCTFRVVHVSGTIRKVEEEAIRRTRLMMLAVREQAGAKGNSALAAILGERHRTGKIVPGTVTDDEQDDPGDEDEKMADDSDD